MLDPLGQAWQNGCALAAKTSGGVVVFKYCLYGSLLAKIRIQIVRIPEDFSNRTI